MVVGHDLTESLSCCPDRDDPIWQLTSFSALSFNVMS